MPETQISAENTRKAASNGLFVPWKPGQSGNPGGRPPAHALRAALRPLEQKAYDAIREGLEQTEDQRLRCENAWKLIERLYGKPDAISAEDLSSEELIAIVLRRKAQEQPTT